MPTSATTGNFTSRLVASRSHWRTLVFHFTTRRVASVLLASAVAAALAAPASVAAKSSDVIARGSCSASSDWKLKASPDDGRIEVRGIVDSDVGGQRWRWKMLHNGSVSARGRATTESGSGEFRVRRLMVNVPGDDRIGWRAKNRKTGEVCRGNLTF